MLLQLLVNNEYYKIYHKNYSVFYFTDVTLRKDRELIYFDKTPNPKNIV